jgi:hypothetical protein
VAEPSPPSSSLHRWFVLLGDAACLALATVIGFASHQEMEAVASARFLATYLPLVLIWLVAAGGLGALEPARARAASQLWRPLVAALVATPVAAILRSLWLGTPPVTLFVGVFTTAVLVGIGIWRAGLTLLLHRRTG